ncbi:MAG TPA: aminotransferase class V-fold PLP-dependent enzyme [Patescibacteria group bacterium]|nr:aminotransferase class V-fold PLP-dependent enzyme [Patescibacteria group bacterium]
MNIETKAVHLGRKSDPHTGAITPPLHLATTFEREAEGTYPRGFIYTRLGNPNRESLEVALAGLEDGAAAAAFSSGLAAIMAIFQALAAGDHVIASQDLYHGTTKMLKEIFGPWNLAVTYVDATEPDQVAAALRPNTRLIFLETPSNPTLRITDLEAIAKIARPAGVRTVVDNTWATSVLQQPLRLGIDLVVHSTTKYMGGHSDVLGGAVVSREQDAFFDRIRLVQQIGGAVPAPFDCWLVHRGLQTLPLRVGAQSDSAAKLARFLAEHPAVEKVYYPGLASHPGHEIAVRQMSRFGGMISFQVRGGREEALALTGALKIIGRATSLGGVESLIEHRASIEGPNSLTPDNLLRFSVGLENADDLIADLDAALTSVVKE